MQPDPDIYYWRAQRELRDLLAAGAVADAAAALVIDRIAELLGQLSLRAEGLADYLAALAPRQDALLADLAAAGQAGPGSAVQGSAIQGAAVQGLDAIAAYDARARAIEDALVALLHAAPGGAEAASLARRARALEAEVRAARAELMARKARAEANAWREDAARPPPPKPEALAGFLRQRTPGAQTVVVSGIRQQKGVNTKDILFFEVAGLPGWPEQVVMRRLRGFNVNHLVSMPYEFALLNALNAAGIATPRALALDMGEAFGEPLIMLERLAGEARRADSLSPEAGRRVVEQMAHHLGRIHALDPAVAGRPEQLALAPQARIAAHVDSYYQLWRANHVEPSALMEAGFGWVRANLPGLSTEAVLVHGDYDLRNVLVDGDRLTAVLDWERSHIGHPAEDLAYCRPDVERFIAWPAFLALYQAAGGRPVTPSELTFFDVWCGVFRMVSINRAHAGYARGEHDDFLLGSSGYMEYVKAAGALEAALSRAEGREAPVRPA